MQAKSELKNPRPATDADEAVATERKRIESRRDALGVRRVATHVGRRDSKRNLQPGRAPGIGQSRASRDFGLGASIVGGSKSAARATLRPQSVRLSVDGKWRRLYRVFFLQPVCSGPARRDEAKRTNEKRKRTHRGGCEGIDRRRRQRVRRPHIRAARTYTIVRQLRRQGQSRKGPNGMAARERSVSHPDWRG